MPEPDHELTESIKKQGSVSLPDQEGNKPYSGITTEDREDLLDARDGEEPSVIRPSWWRRVGPGLLTGVADDEPSAIGTYSVTGAAYGYALLWLIPITLPMMIVVQEMCGRVAVVTGKGLAAIIKQHYPKWVLYIAVVLLIAANVTNIYADLNAMAASAQMLFHGSFVIWLSVITALIIALHIAVPYRIYVRILKWLCLSLLAYVVVDFMPTVEIDWVEIGRHLIKPNWQWDSEYILTVVDFLGTCICPYLFFWQAGEQVQDNIVQCQSGPRGRGRRQASLAEIHSMRNDTIIGMVAAQAVAFFIIVCTATTLFNNDITDITTAQDAARALRPLGPAAVWIFTLGIVGTGFLGIPALAGSAAYAVAETTGWRYGMYRRFSRAKWFYLTIAGVILAGYFLNFIHALSPIKALLYSAALNGIVAPPLIVILLLICNNKKIIGKRRNGWISNIIGWLTVLIMGAAAGYLLWALFVGKVT